MLYFICASNTSIGSYQMFQFFNIIYFQKCFKNIFAWRNRKKLTRNNFKQFQNFALIRQFLQLVAGKHNQQEVFKLCSRI